MFYAEYTDINYTWFVKEATSRDITLTMDFDNAIKFSSRKEGEEYFRKRGYLFGIEIKYESVED